MPCIHPTARKAEKCPGSDSAVLIIVREKSVPVPRGHKDEIPLPKMPTKLSNLELLSKTDERIFTQSGRQLGAFIIVFRNVSIVAMNDG